MSDEPLNDEAWDPEHTAIVGPFPDVRLAEERLRAALAELGREIFAEHQRGSNIARIYQLGSTGWVSTGADVVAHLASADDSLEIFGVDVDYEDTGNSVTKVWPVVLRCTDGELFRERQLPAQPDDRDALDAVLGWEARTAARQVGLDLEPDAASRVYSSQ